MEDWRQYELGVTDAIAHVAGDGARVEHNVRLHGRYTGRRRQIDTLLTGVVFGLADAVIVVDSKLRTRKITVGEVDALIGLVDDVGADLAILVSNTELTEAARGSAENARLRVRTLTYEELEAWTPPGARFQRIAVAADAVPKYNHALGSAGFRLRAVNDEPPPGEAFIEFFRLSDVSSQGAEAFSALAEKTLQTVSEPYRHISSGVVANGGTPAHKWIPLTVPGQLGPIRVLAATENELAERVADVAALFTVAACDVVVERPDGWPVPSGPGSFATRPRRES